LQNPLADMTSADPAILDLSDDTVPPGWALARLGDGLLTDLQPGFACGTNSREASGVPHLRPMNVSCEGRISLSDVKFVPAIAVQRERQWLRYADVLFNNTNSAELVGKTAFYDLDEPHAFSNHMTRLRCREDRLDPRFCAKVLHYLWQMGYFESVCSHHVSQASVGRSVLLDTVIPLPPVSEQQRIIAKVEELLAHVNAARDHLARVLATLKRLRHSILGAACSGRLTGGVRAGSLDDALPPRWRWATVEELVPRGGLFDGPFGSSLRTSDYTTSGVRVIRLENVGHLRFVESKTSYVSQQKYKTLERHTVRGGDILFASFIEDEVRACVLPPLEGAAIAKADCFCLRPKAELVDRHYLALQLVSDSSRSQLLESVHGATRPRVNTRQLRALKVRLCPLPEQGEIVRCVQAFSTLANTVEQRVAAAAARADRLARAILAKAFRGELVPTAGDSAGATVSNGE
jgi:Type I restriction modification DNA specificity domain